jgi:hypothetical protein
MGISQAMNPASHSPTPEDRAGLQQGGQAGLEQGGRGAGRNDGKQGTGQQGETYGPLDIERYVKDDGRLLILYARQERHGA